MSDDALDARLHAFLDGRLSSDERREIESRLRDDPELAARLESYREIGDALREDDAELPPGFHARARARFAGAGARRPWFRPLSWETLGVAAAAVLALAVFVPAWMQGESPLESVGAVSESTADTADPPKPAPAPGAGASQPLPTLSGERDAADEPGRQRAAKPATAPIEKKAKTKGAVAASEDFAQVPAESAREPAAGRLAEESVAEEREAFRDTPRAESGLRALEDYDARRRDDDGFASEAAPSAPSALVAQTAEVADEKEGHATATDPTKDREAALAQMAELSNTAEPFSARPMQARWVERGEILVIDDVDALRRAEAQQRAQQADDTAAAATPAEPGKDDKNAKKDAAAKQEAKAQRKRNKARVRWLLIGPRDLPFACAGFKITSDGDSWIIGLAAPTAEHPAAPHGCTLTLPLDGKAVRVTGP